MSIIRNGHAKGRLVTNECSLAPWVRPSGVSLSSDPSASVEYRAEGLSHLERSTVITGGYAACGDGPSSVRN
eukprot:16432683-Heterocapsa_arctica.AAC.1